jgi:F-type H+-transporting ATPase subunit a
MITNLFSIFDPSTSTMSSTWLMLAAPIIMLRQKSNKKSNQERLSKNLVVSTLEKEISHSTGKPKKGLTKINLRIFMLIATLNTSAIYPIVFSTTSHLTVNLTISLILWARLIIIGWTKNTKNILAHIVPQGTPNALINFMVLIEITRNLIRPITLCVRLTANIVAGHLLLSLLGGFILTINKPIILIITPAPIILCILETAVAFIQAYVFITLITLYSTEIH